MKWSWGSRNILPAVLLLNIEFELISLVVFLLFVALVWMDATDDVCCSFPWRFFFSFLPGPSSEKSGKNRVWGCSGLSWWSELGPRMDGPVVSFINKSCDSWLGIIRLCIVISLVGQSVASSGCVAIGLGRWVNGRLSGWPNDTLKSTAPRYNGNQYVVLRDVGFQVKPN